MPCGRERTSPGRHPGRERTGRHRPFDEGRHTPSVEPVHRTRTSGQMRGHAHGRCADVRRDSREIQSTSGSRVPSASVDPLNGSRRSDRHGGRLVLCASGNSAHAVEALRSPPHHTGRPHRPSGPAPGPTDGLGAADSSALRKDPRRPCCGRESHRSRVCTCRSSYAMCQGCHLRTARTEGEKNHA